MALTPGASLGPYTILAGIGAGGMGEVYRARDARLGRDVAIKVLPEPVANDRDRLARFEREARAVAALSHPNILSIHEFDRADGVAYAVMELLEGETLRACLEAGAVPVRKAVDIAVQIARGLAAAHNKGIVHRDLKPENIFLREDGQVKVLDFGLARAITADSAVTETVGTDPGTVLGTAGYMAPEQVRGQTADPRTDLFALGVVLYEMLSGQRAFRRESAAETMSAILRDDPPQLAGSRSDLSPALDRIVRHCLEKKPGERFQTARDVAFALEALSGSETSGARITAIEDRRGWRRAVMAAAIAGVLVAAVLAWQSLPRTAVPSPVLRFVADLGADAYLLGESPGWNRAPSAVLSPDGKTMAFVARSAAGQTSLYVRPLDQLRATMLPDTVGAANPFFSPDGEWIGFFVEGELKKVPARGGVPVSLCRVSSPLTGVRGAWWSEDGTIVFQPSGTSASLLRVAATGGSPEPLGSKEPGAATIRWPQVLPGGRVILYTSHDSLTNFDGADLVVRTVPDGTPKRVLEGGYHGRYVSSGHLIFMRQGRLMAAPFDLAQLEVVGPAVPVLDGIETSPGNAGAQFAVSETGTLVYVEGTSTLGTEGAMGWLDATGRVSPLRADVVFWGGPKFSPDGETIALHISDGHQFHVWTYGWRRGAADRLSFDAVDNQAPVWSPAGGALVVSVGSAVSANLYWRRVDRTGPLQRLTNSQGSQLPWSWHSSGKFLAITESSPEHDSFRNVKILAMEGDDSRGWKVTGETMSTQTLSPSPAPTFSPDGRWIAYVTSAGSEQAQVFVRPFPEEGGPWQVSTEGGSFPVWSDVAPELFFAAPSGHIMRTQYAVDGNAFRVISQPALWTTTTFEGVGVGRPFDLHPDGRRFAIKPVRTRDTAPRIRQVVLVLNFFDELRRLSAN